MRTRLEDDRFPTDPTGLPEARRPERLDLVDGATLDLAVGPVANRVGNATVRMLAYNGSIPGPTIAVPVGAEVTVNVANHGDLETTVHWHGLRLANRYDGVPHDTQEPIPVGGTFSYRVTFPDPGLYWYHPHVREDYAQELGLYGNILVVPAEPDYWPPADRDLVLTVDDLLMDGTRVAPFRRTGPTHAAMGRFGDVFLTGGETDPRFAAVAGEVLRLWLTNTANARVFNLALPGARMKRVGGDSGRLEHEELVSEVLLGPSERAVVDVLVDRPGELALEHRMPRRTVPLARFTVTGDPPEPGRVRDFELLRQAPEFGAERRQLPSWLAAPPDKVLALVASIDDPDADGAPAGYSCPMHPDVTSAVPGRCPRCGMKLLAGQHQAGPVHHAGADGGIEWDDDMAEVNKLTTPATVHWTFVDRTTGADQPVAGWRFRVGDRVKVRLVNEMDSDHPMHHPFHVHGAGRFLVLARDGVPEPNLVWKDTVLLRTGQTVDILLDLTNPGRWMAHCHIPEHMHSGMMFGFTVTP